MMKVTDDSSSAEPTGAQREPAAATAAQRALAEAADRKAQAAKAEIQARAEIAGRGGLDPVRYGDWEVKGLTSDF